MGWCGKHGWLGDVGSLAAFRSIQPWAGCTEYWTFKYCCIAFTGDVMSYARQMLDTYPRAWAIDVDVLAAAIDALSDCTQACHADNAADLSEQNVTEMVTCIRLCLDCTDVCTATLGVVSRQTASDAAVTGPLLEVCIAICKSCGDECERHARMHEHCRVCAEACRRCERACRGLLAA